MTWLIVGGEAMANAMFDPRWEDEAYRWVEVIMGQRRQRRDQSQQISQGKN